MDLGGRLRISAPDRLHDRGVVDVRVHRRQAVCGGERPVAVRLVEEAVRGLDQVAVARALDQEPVEAEVGLVPAVEVLRFERTVHRGDRVVERSEFLGRDAARGSPLGGLHLEARQHLGDLADVAWRQRAHAHAAPGDDLDVALVLESHQRLVHGRAAHAELEREFRLQHLQPRRERPVDDRALDPPVGGIGLALALAGAGRWIVNVA